jgi:hypothetical protein
MCALHVLYLFRPEARLRHVADLAARDRHQHVTCGVRAAQQKPEHCFPGSGNDCSSGVELFRHQRSVPQLTSRGLDCLWL